MHIVSQIKSDDIAKVFSQVSLLEMEIKVNSGKLKIDFNVEEVPTLARLSGFQYRPLTNAAIFNLAKLPDIHRDPFDRLLIGEVMAMGEGTKLCTSDVVIPQYPVDVLW